MHPSYEDLCLLNPLLRAKKTPDEVAALQVELEANGYYWDPLIRRYINPDIGRELRTQGLDLFTPGAITEFTREANARLEEDPEREIGKAIAMGRMRRFGPWFLLIFFLNLVAGWMVFPIWVWLGVLAALVAVHLSWTSYVHRKYFSDSGSN